MNRLELLLPGGAILTYIAIPRPQGRELEGGGGQGWEGRAEGNLSARTADGRKGGKEAKDSASTSRLPRRLMGIESLLEEDCRLLIGGGLSCLWATLPMEFPAGNRRNSEQAPEVGPS